MQGSVQEKKKREFRHYCGGTDSVVVPGTIVEFSVTKLLFGACKKGCANAVTLYRTEIKGMPSFGGGGGRGGG